jgi:hypothetical protein
MSKTEVPIRAGHIEGLAHYRNWRVPSFYAARDRMMQAVEDAVCEQFGLGPGGMRMPGRVMSNVWPRWIAIYFMRLMTPASTAQIADWFDQDRGTIWHAANAVTEQRLIYKTMRLELAEMEQRISARLGKVMDVPCPSHGEATRSPLPPE